MWESLTIGLGVSATAIFAAMGSLVIMTVIRLRQTPATHTIFMDKTDETVFLFDATTLVDATPAARKLLAINAGSSDPWTRLMLWLSPRFPDLAQQLDDQASVGMVMLSDDGNKSQRRDASPMTLQAEWRGGMTRIRLSNPQHDDVNAAQDGMIHHAMSRDLADLNGVLSQAPVLIWREDEDGTISWANAPYIVHVERELPPDQRLRWPLPKLFESPTPNARARSNRQRLNIRTEDGALWFDLIESRAGRTKVIYAIPVDSALHAEVALKDFMQTLTKTFAHLATGLAIFDQHRRLQLFNPAMLDLTGLPIDLLSQRPTLQAFLDALRDRNMMPEPKNYRTWRERIIDLELAAEAGTFEETWTLPNGQIYRITGRPHPNQALALVFEDISTEMLQTRRYRAALALSNEMLDVMEDAVVLFSPGGKLARTNAAYDRLWDHDAGKVMAQGGIAALMMDWQDVAVPTKGWSKIHDYVSAGGAPNPCSGEVRMNDGRSIGFRCVTLQDGACLVIFRVLTLSLPFEVVSSRPVLKTA